MPKAKQVIPPNPNQRRTKGAQPPIASVIKPLASESESERTKKIASEIWLQNDEVNQILLRMRGAAGSLAFIGEGLTNTDPIAQRACNFIYDTLNSLADDAIGHTNTICKLSGKLKAGGES